MKKRRVVLILLVLAAAAGGAWYWYSDRMNATNNIQVSGNLELTQVDLSFKTAGRMTELAVR
jgi:HlyD family secretion protein